MELDSADGIRLFEGVVSLGNGKRSEIYCKMLQLRLEKALSALSALQQGHPDEDGSCQKLIESVVLDTAAALGCEVELKRDKE